ncbi:RidA family protein [Peloplasma aerotolerans]|jgi:2-iminobutanoate/2-iminopropanoate deaminase|uniref:RidA family protein n=1 Tax=Peloplasma aerotolerans TaxID=3044389 RepID=A0AAW6UBA1_9MOLU|nr:RidA family protein [Mariniplasma sp. M4Ah]MDI6452791.1 RidA family protein [Mariniplasma sp. M4Ah]
MKKIETNKAPRAVGAYSQGVLVNETLYVSGQIPFVPDTMELVSNDIKEQTRQSLDNILGIVEAAGLKKENIVRCGVFMTDLGDFQKMNEVYASFFGDHKPARAAVEVRRLPKDVQIEIDAIAIKY